MGFVDSLRDVFRTFTEDDYDEYDDAPVSDTRHGDIYRVASTASTAPDYALHHNTSAQPHKSAWSPSTVPDPAVSAIALLCPENLESVRAAADHLLQNRAVILNLKHTDPALARRWLDYLGGTAYTLGGKMNRIASYTYLLTPKNIDLVAGFESEA